MNYFPNLNFYIVEVIIFVGALLSIVVGAFIKKNKFNKVSLLSLATLFVAFVLILLSDINNFNSNKIFVNNIFTNVAKLFILGLSFAILYVSKSYVKNNNIELFEYPILMLFAVLGMLLMVSANDFLLLYISVELQSLSLYVLVALNRDSLKSSEAALKYFILGSIASAIILPIA